MSLLERDPELTFLLDGQTVLFEDYLRVRPDRRAALQVLAAEKRIETGPWYVLADEQIPSGESLIRNLLLGSQDARALGHRLPVLYSPDAFGHPAVLPLLAAEFDLPYAVIWRGLGHQAGGSDLMHWRAPDGREVLLYHLPPEGYEHGSALTSDLETLSRRWPALRRELTARAATRHVALFVGADHHAPRPDLRRLRDALASLEPQGEVRLSGLEEYFSAAASEAGDLPRIDGELRWSYGYAWTLQGALGTRTPLKRRHGRAELLLARHADPLAALAWAAGGADRRPVLTHAWRTLVRGQFHDTLCGTCADEVAARQAARLGDVVAAAREILRSAIEESTGQDPDRIRESVEPLRAGAVLWNPVPRLRDGLVLAEASFFRRDVLVGPVGDRMVRTGPGYQPFHLLAESGGEIPVQVLEVVPGQERRDAARHYPDQDEVDRVRIAFRPPSARGMRLESLTLASGKRRAQGDAWAEGLAAGNSLIEARLEGDGSLVLLDKLRGKEWRGLLTLEDELDGGDAYTWCPVPGDWPRRATGPVAARVLFGGPLVAALEARWELTGGRRRGNKGPGRVGIRLLVLVHAGDPTLRCSLQVTNDARDHRLRARFPVGPADLLAGTQFGCVRRDPVSVDPERYPGEIPAATAPAHGFVAACGNQAGLALLGAACFEYEWTAAGYLYLTLLRAVGELSRGDLRTRPGHAGWPISIPLAQCPGTDLIDLALAPVGPEDLAEPARLWRCWEEAFLPRSAVWMREMLPGSDRSGHGLLLEGAGLVSSSIKPAEAMDGVVMRCFNPGRLAVEGSWVLPAPAVRAWRTRADELGRRELPLSDGGRRVRFRADAGEVVTLLIEGGFNSRPE